MSSTHHQGSSMHPPSQTPLPTHNISNMQATTTTGRRFAIPISRIALAEKKVRWYTQAVERITNSRRVSQDVLRYIQQLKPKHAFEYLRARCLPRDGKKYAKYASQKLRILERNPLFRPQNSNKRKRAQDAEGFMAEPASRVESSKRRVKARTGDSTDRGSRRSWQKQPEDAAFRAFLAAAGSPTPSASTSFEGAEELRVSFEGVSSRGAPKTSNSHNARSPTSDAGSVTFVADEGDLASQDPDTTLVADESDDEDVEGKYLQAQMDAGGSFSAAPERLAMPNGVPWTSEEDAKIVAAVKRCGENWEAVASEVNTRRCTDDYEDRYCGHLKLLQPGHHCLPFTPLDDKVIAKLCGFWKVAPNLDNHPTDLCWKRWQGLLRFGTPDATDPMYVQAKAAYIERTDEASWTPSQQALVKRFRADRQGGHNSSSSPSSRVVGGRVQRVWARPTPGGFLNKRKSSMSPLAQYLHFR